MRYQTKLASEFTEEQIKEIKWIFDKVKRLKQEELEILYKKIGKEENFKDPNWNEHNAYLIGRIKQLQADIELLTIKLED